MGIRKCLYDSPLGTIVLAAEDDALIGLWFDGQLYFPAGAISWIESGDNPVLRKAKSWLDAYFGGENPLIDFALAPKGSEFRQLVWKKLLVIPYGETSTYGSIAREIQAEQKRESKLAAQAVGGAVGHNPISLIIPCHRVVGTNQKLIGYGGGLHRKEALLRLEGWLR